MVKLCSFVLKNNMKTFNEVFDANEKSSNRQENLKTNKLLQLMDKQSSLRDKVEMYEKEYNNSILNPNADTFKFYLGLQLAKEELNHCKELIRILFPDNV